MLARRNMTDNNKPTPQSLLTLAWRIWSASGNPVFIDNAAMRTELEPALRDGVVLEDEKGLRFATELSMVHATARHILQTEEGRRGSGPLLALNA